MIFRLEILEECKQMSGLASALVAINVPKEDFKSQSAKDRLLAAVTELIAKFGGIRVVAKHRFTCSLAVVGPTSDLAELGDALSRQKLGAVQIENAKEPALKAAYD